jgi:hypothetical protein
MTGAVAIDGWGVAVYQHLPVPQSTVMSPFPVAARRTGHVDLPHPALGQDITLSPTEGRA